MSCPFHRNNKKTHFNLSNNLIPSEPFEGNWIQKKIIGNLARLDCWRFPLCMYLFEIFTFEMGFFFFKRALLSCLQSFTSIYVCLLQYAIKVNCFSSKLCETNLESGLARWSSFFCVLNISFTCIVLNILLGMRNPDRARQGQANLLC